MSYVPKTVFVLGAGVNKVMTNWVDITLPKASRDKTVSPPLMKDFFIVVSRLNRFNNCAYRRRIQPVYDFIKEYWALTISELAYTPFNIEECFTSLHSKFTEAERTGDDVRARELFSIQLNLKRLLVEVLAEFNGVERTGVMRAFGQMLFQLKPVIISFNYDCFIETIIEIASGQNRRSLGRNVKHVKTDEISDSYWNWNLPRGYGIKFDYVMIHDRFSNHPLRRKYVEGKTFYSNSKNHLYPWCLLKLHGSLNWFRYVPRELFSPSQVKAKEPLSLAKRSDIILGHLNLLKTEHPKIKNTYVDPIIVTPGFNKEYQFSSVPYLAKIAPLWKKAENALAHCKNLVVVGYSFPPTDDEAKVLFKRAFSDNFSKSW